MNHLITLLITILIAYTMSMSAQGVGIGTNTPKATLNVAEHKTVLFGKDTSGAGGKLMWLPSKYCFRAGVTGPIYGVGGGEYDYGNPATWDYDSLGYFSFAGGFNNLALGNSSVALGGYNQARGEFSVALGSFNKAIGNFSFAAGIVAVASRYSSVAIGQGAKSLSDNATAIGNYVEASGNSSLATGYITKASGFSSVSTGHYTEAPGYFSFAGGSESKSLGEYSIAIGQTNIAAGKNTIALSASTIANAINSFVIGRYNDTIAGSNLNSWVPSDPLFILGNGSSNANRNNAMIILKNGNAGIGTNTPGGLLHLKYNSNTSSPNLMLEESGNDYARITFKNANPGFWNVSAYAHQIFDQNIDSRFSFFCSTLGGNVLTLKGNGDASLSGTLTQYSDERLKDHIQPITQVLPKLAMIHGYTYLWKDPARGNNEQMGVLAQEVEKQFPQVVHTDEEGMKSVAYGNMIPILIEAIHEQQAQIDELRSLLESKMK